eukprot:403372609
MAFNLSHSTTNLNATRMSLGLGSTTNLHEIQKNEFIQQIEVMKKDLRTKDQELNTQKALFEQQIQLYKQEIDDLKEKEISQKRLYEKMLQALNQNTNFDQSYFDPSSSSDYVHSPYSQQCLQNHQQTQQTLSPRNQEQLFEYQRRVSELELEIEKVKSKYKLQLLAANDDLNTEKQIVNNLKVENQQQSQKAQQVSGQFELQIQDKNSKIKQLEEQLSKKDEFRRVSKLFDETREKLDQLSLLKQNEIDCQKLLFDNRYQDLKSQTDEEKLMLLKEIDKLKDLLREKEGQVRERERHIEKILSEHMNQMQISELATQFEQFKQQNQGDIGKVAIEKEELRVKADKFEKLYNKLKLESKNQFLQQEIQIKQLMNKLQQQQNIIEQSEQTKEDLRKYKKLFTQQKEKEQRNEAKSKELTKNYLEIEEQLRKDIDFYKSQNKKLKVELEQIKVMNAKIKDDIESLKSQHIKELYNQKVSKDKSQKLQNSRSNKRLSVQPIMGQKSSSTQNIVNSGSTVINASITVGGSSLQNPQSQHNIIMNQQNLGQHQIQIPDDYYNEDDLQDDYQNQIVTSNHINQQFNRQSMTNTNQQQFQNNDPSTRRESMSSTKQFCNYASNYGNQMFMQTQLSQQKQSISRQKSAGKLTTKNQFSKSINLNQTLEGNTALQQPLQQNLFKDSCLIDQKPSNRRNQSPLQIIQTEQIMNFNKNRGSMCLPQGQSMNYQSDNRKNNMKYITDYQIQPLSVTSKLSSQNPLTKSLSSVNFGKYEQSSLRKSTYNQQQHISKNQSMIETNYGTSTLPTPNHEPLCSQSQYNQQTQQNHQILSQNQNLYNFPFNPQTSLIRIENTIQNEDETTDCVDQVKTLKKEIQKLVTVLMQKEGKLSRGGVLSEGQVVIKLSNKNSRAKKENINNSLGNVTQSQSLKQLQKSYHNMNFNDYGLGGDNTTIIDQDSQQVSQQFQLNQNTGKKEQNHLKITQHQQQYQDQSQSTVLLDNYDNENCCNDTNEEQLMCVGQKQNTKRIVDLPLQIKTNGQVSSHGAGYSPRNNTNIYPSIQPKGLFQQLN